MNYYCTWVVQNNGRPDCENQTEPEAFLGLEGARKGRNYMNEEVLFKDGGMADQYDEIRGDLYFLLDDGWDVPYDILPFENNNIRFFGALIPHEDRFPSYKGTPAQRIKQINDDLKKMGWKGAALWVAAQGTGEDFSHHFTKEESVKYWSERLEWSKEAGIEYWKVDWGVRSEEPEWRNMLNELRDQIYPTLHVEHAVPMKPVNHVVLKDGKQVSDGRFSSTKGYPQKWEEILINTEILRSYDILDYFAEITTMDRIGTFMTDYPEARAVLNCEDCMYLGASMGFSLGIMRSGLCKKITAYCADPKGLTYKTDEVIRAVKWQRIAPAYPINEGRLKGSEEVLTVTHHFEKGDSWMEALDGHDVHQSCCAVYARNMELPEVRYLEENKPLITVSTHPNGAISAYAVPREDENREYYTPKAGIVLKNIKSHTPIGIFGFWEYVILAGEEDYSQRKIWAADLLNEKEVDITDSVKIEGNRIHIGREILHGICTNKDGDTSDPGMVFYVR